MIRLYRGCGTRRLRSEEHTSELQSPYVISYAVFCLKKKTWRHGHERGGESEPSLSPAHRGGARVACCARSTPVVQNRGVVVGSRPVGFFFFLMFRRPQRPPPFPAAALFL